MSDLVWMCNGGTVLSSVENGLELVVSRESDSVGFRYQLLRHSAHATPAKVSVASGHCQQLSEAISTAETIAKRWGTRRHDPVAG